MPSQVPCAGCGYEIPQPAERCPHCGRPGIFWNVIAATDASEEAALDRRYKTARSDAAQRGADVKVQHFEDTLKESKAIIATSVTNLSRLASSHRQLHATYYDLIGGPIKFPEGSEWDLLRVLADVLLFGEGKKHIRFAALSLNDIGLTNYGPCALILKEHMISHRSSVFEENCALFMERKGIRVQRQPKLPKGYKATWERRARLCVAKLADRIDSGTTSDKYSEILLKNGTTSAQDEFVEVHIWGPFTVFTLEKVKVIAQSSSARATILKAIKFKLSKYGVPVS